MMKYFFILFFVSGCLSVEEKCYMAKEETHCSGYHLQIDEPLQVNLSHKTIEIRRSTGSIGFKTLSLLPDTETLRITYSNITNVENGALCSSSKLQALALELNTIFPVLTESLLSNCETIKYFEIRAQALEPTALKHMTNLEVFHIDILKIPHFTKQYLEPLKGLKEFSFAWGELEIIDPAVFCISPKLEKLILTKSNVLQRLTKSLFEGCNNLSHLEIGNVIYEEYKPPIDVEENLFSDLTELKVLKIVNLNIGHLTKTYFGSLGLLEELYLFDCNIEEIDIDAFEGLRNLKKLALGRSNLTYVDPKVFASLTNLEDLDLSENKLVNIDNFKLPQLESLNLLSNSISSVNVDAVHSNLPKLYYLMLLLNPIASESREELQQYMEKYDVSVVV